MSAESFEAPKKLCVQLSIDNFSSNPFLYFFSAGIYLFFFLLI